MKLKMILQVISLTMRLYFATRENERLKQRISKLDSRIAAIGGGEKTCQIETTLN